MTSWPRGLRRYVQVVILIGVGSNPTDVTFYTLKPFYHSHYDSAASGLLSQTILFGYKLFYGFSTITPYTFTNKTRNHSCSYLSFFYSTHIYSIMTHGLTSLPCYSINQYTLGTATLDHDDSTPHRILMQVDIHHYLYISLHLW